MSEHAWSGWPGAWCLNCGVEDPRERALAENRMDGDGNVILTPEEASSLQNCPEPGSNRWNPYVRPRHQSPVD